jgi:hypothetical protein
MNGKYLILEQLKTIYWWLALMVTSSKKHIIIQFRLYVPNKTVHEYSILILFTTTCFGPILRSSSSGNDYRKIRPKHAVVNITHNIHVLSSWKHALDNDVTNTTGLRYLQM